MPLRSLTDRPHCAPVSWFQARRTLVYMTGGLSDMVGLTMATHSPESSTWPRPSSWSKHADG